MGGEIIGEASDLAHQIVVRASERNAANVKLLDIRNLSTIADYFVICTATSTVHVKALSEEMLSVIKEELSWKGRAEGLPSDGWMVVDSGDVLVHIFLEEKRSYYGLEELWAEAPALVRLP